MPRPFKPLDLPKKKNLEVLAAVTEHACCLASATFYGVLTGRLYSLEIVSDRELMTADVSA